MGRLPKGEGLRNPGDHHNNIKPFLGCLAAAVSLTGGMFLGLKDSPEEPHGIPPATPATTSSEQSASVPSEFPVRPERKAEIDEKAKNILQDEYWRGYTGTDAYTGTDTYGSLVSYFYTEDGKHMTEVAVDNASTLENELALKVKITKRDIKNGGWKATSEVLLTFDVKDSSVRKETPMTTTSLEEFLGAGLSLTEVSNLDHKGGKIVVVTFNKDGMISVEEGQGVVINGSMEFDSINLHKVGDPVKAQLLANGVLDS